VRSCHRVTWTGCSGFIEVVTWARTGRVQLSGFEIHRWVSFFNTREKKWLRGIAITSQRIWLPDSSVGLFYKYQKKTAAWHRYHKPAHLLCTSQRSCTPSTLIIPAETTGRIAPTNQRHKSKVDNVHLLHSYLFPSFG